MSPKLLIVDDSAQIRVEIRRVLEEAKLEADILEAETGVEALKLLALQPADVVLCDVQMPQLDGFQFLRMMRARPENAATAVIMITGRDAPDEKIFGLEAGAADYVTKPFVAGELVARVKVQLKLKALQDELRKANEKLRESSATDFLTGLYNRRHFSEMLESEYRRAQRYKNALSLALLDIDHFKAINDKYGHTTGDSVLTDLAQLLRSSFRSSDVIARYGGEEFVVLLPHTPLLDAKIAVDKVRTQLKELAIGSLERGALSFSGGIATYPSETVDTTQVLIARADRALYLAKESGRNRVVVDASDAAPEPRP